MKRHERLVHLPALAAAKALLGVHLLSTGFTVVSGDDLLRSLIAWQWAGEPFFVSTAYGEASVLWMPMHFWVTGSLMRVWPDPWLAPATASLFFSIIVVVLIYLIARELTGEGRAALLAALLAGFVPWETWLGVSGTAATLYQSLVLAGLLATLRSAADGGLARLPLAALFFLLATAVRPEGWLFAGVFTLYCAWRCARERPDPAGTLIIALSAAAVWLFVLYWLWFNHANYGNALYFLQRARESYASEAAGIDSLWVRLLGLPLVMVAISPLLCLLTIVYLIFYFNDYRRDRLKALWVCFSLAGLALLAAASASGSGTRSTPQRYVVIYLLLFVPLVSAMLSRWLGGRRSRPLAVFVTAVLLFGFAAGTFDYPREYADEARLGRVLKELWRGGALGESDLVADERTWLAYAAPDRPPGGFRDLMYSLTRRWALQVFSGRPEGFVYRLSEDMDLRFTMDRNKVAALMESGRIRAALVRGAAPRAGASGAVLPYTIEREGYTILTDSARLRSAFEAHRAEVGRKAPKKLDDSLEFLGYNLDDNLFPRHLTLYFGLGGKGPPKKALVLLTGYEEAGGGRRVVTERTELDLSSCGPGEVVERRIYFPVGDGLPAGSYRVSVDLVAHGKAPERLLSTGPLTVITSKRDVIRSFLAGERRNIGLLLKVVSSL